MRNGLQCAAEMVGTILFMTVLWAAALPFAVFLAVKHTLARYSDGHV